MKPMTGHTQLTSLRASETKGASDTSASIPKKLRQKVVVAFHTSKIQEVGENEYLLRFLATKYLGKFPT